MMKYSIDIAKCYNWLDFMVSFLIQIVYRSTKAVWISDFKEHMKQSLFLWGSVFAPENLSLLGEATPCCLVTEKLGMVEESSSIHTSTAHTHYGEREKVRERELSKVITEVWREDETEHASLFTSLIHFIITAKSSRAASHKMKKRPLNQTNGLKSGFFTRMWSFKSLK